MRDRQQGQIALATVLLMAVLLTAGLSLAARSAEDLSLSSKQAESTRVFNAAEAGIEEALSSDFDFSGNEQIIQLGSEFITNTDVSYSIQKADFLELIVTEGESVNFDVSNTQGDGGRQVEIHWVDEAAQNCGSDNPASLIIAVYSENAGAVNVRYETARACDHGDNFSNAAVSNSPEDDYRYRKRINLSSEDVLLRVRPVYNETPMLILADNFSAETQFFRIRSEAKNIFGEEARNVEVQRSAPIEPSIFDFAVYSGNAIIK